MADGRSCGWPQPSNWPLDNSTARVKGASATTTSTTVGTVSDGCRIRLPSLLLHLLLHHPSGVRHGGSDATWTKSHVARRSSGNDTHSYCSPQPQHDQRSMVVEAAVSPFRTRGTADGDGGGGGGGGRRRRPIAISTTSCHHRWRLLNGGAC